MHPGIKEDLCPQWVGDKRSEGSTFSNVKRPATEWAVPGCADRIRVDPVDRVKFFGKVDLHPFKICFVGRLECVLAPKPQNPTLL